MCSIVGYQCAAREPDKALDIEIVVYMIRDITTYQRFSDTVWTLN